MKKLNLIILLLLLSVIGFCQERIYVDSKSVVETKGGSILIFNNLNEQNLYFYIDHTGEKAETTEQENLFNLGTYTLQILAVKKGDYEGKNDMQTLKKYADHQIDYFTNAIKANLESKSQKISIGDKSDYLLWHFKMPSSISKDVKNQLFITFIHKDLIIGYSSTQFSDQTFDEVLEFLKKLISETNIVEERITFEFLCNQRK